MAFDDDNYVLDADGNRILVGLTLDETREFESLDELISRNIPMSSVSTDDDRSPIKGVGLCFMKSTRLQRWTASEDGKTPNYRGDTVEFLRSLPDGARLKIGVRDSKGSRHEGLFQLPGLDAIRKNVRALCKWSPAADRISSGKR